MRPSAFLALRPSSVKEHDRAILAAIENEQGALSQALHDTICQSLSGIHILAHLLATKLQSLDSPSLSREALDLRDLVQEASAEVHGLVRWMRPPILGTEGIIFALEELCRETSERIPCRLQYIGPPAGLDAYTASQLLHIAHACIHYAGKRPGVKNIELLLDLTCPEQRLIIRDDGPPFDVSLARLYGWDVVLRRAKVAGATLKVEAGETGGMVVSCHRSIPEKTDPEPADAA